jgi:hypothetical protein
MYPREPHDQDVLFAVSRLAGNPANGSIDDPPDGASDRPPSDRMDCAIDAARQSATGARFEFTINRQREAALLHRNGRLRAIQALHRSAK